ncbi:unnamed protein product, partial [Mesorhabditis belari]|uniref:G protein-coupled receptor n=1 Tax=Mesorhabditis belari TaxID=2138241 RepID=A0AAF3EDW9_9BILA
MIYISRLDRSVQEEYIGTYYPNSLNLLSYTNWVIIPPSIGNSYEIMFMWFFEVLLFNLIVALVIFQIIRLLRQYTFTMSPSTLKAHRHFVRALFIQALIPFIVYSTPVVIGLICALFGFQSDRNSSK